MNEVANVKKSSLGEHCQSIEYGFTASAEHTPVGPHFLRITDLRGDGVDWNTVPYCQCDTPGKFSLEKGDIVVARTGGTTGKSYLLQESPETAVFASYLIRIRTADSLLPRYLHHFMNGPSYWKQISEAMTGSAQGGVNKTKLSNLQIPVPALDVQRRITATLDTLTSHAQHANDYLTAIPPLIDKFRQSVLARAFTGELTADWRKQNPDVEPASKLLERIKVERRNKWIENYARKLADRARKRNQKKGKPFTDQDWQAYFDKKLKAGAKKYEEPEPVDPEKEDLPEIPESWEWVTMAQVTTESLYGPRIAKTDYVADGIPTLRTTDFTDSGRVVLDRPPEVEINPIDLEKYRLKAGDILITRSGSVGKCALYEDEVGPAIASAYLIRYRFTQDFVRPAFLLRYLLSPWGQRLLGAGATSVTQPNVNATTIAKFPVPLPPVIEQTEILRHTGDFLDFVSANQAQVLRTSDCLEQLQSSVLSATLNP